MMLHPSIAPRSRNSHPTAPAPNTRARRRSRVALLLALPFAVAQAQPSSCSSDGLEPPPTVLERFISADCAECWRDPATPSVDGRTWALDWVFSGAQGEDAALSPVARPEANARAQAAGLRSGTAMPPRFDRFQSVLAAEFPQNPRRLRVAQGTAFGGYVGASIRYTPARDALAPLTAHLALIEIFPAGTEGSPVTRALVRNVFTPTWSGRTAGPRPRWARLDELRPLNIPEGAHPARLRVFGWVEDARGRIIDAALSACTP